MESFRDTRELDHQALVSVNNVAELELEPGDVSVNAPPQGRGARANRLAAVGNYFLLPPQTVLVISRAGTRGDEWDGDKAAGILRGVKRARRFRRRKRATRSGVD